MEHIQNIFYTNQLERQFGTKSNALAMTALLDLQRSAGHFVGIRLVCK